MVRRRSLLLLVAADALWVALSVRLALEVDIWRRSLLGVALDLGGLIHFSAISVVWLSALFICGAYDRRYLALRGRTLGLTMFGCTAATAAFAGGCYLVPAWHMSRLAFLALGVLAGVGLVLIRWLWLTVGRHVYLPEFLGVGDPEVLAGVWEELAKALGARRPLVIVTAGGIPASRSRAGVRHCSERTALDALERHGRDLVVLSDGTIPSPEGTQILTRASLAGCTVADIFTFYERHTGRAPIFKISGRWTFRAHHRSPDPAAYLVKRALDLVATVVLLILAIPTIAIAALLIKLTSPGPVFFVQRRTGYRGREFSLLKLRTMGAEAAPGSHKAWTEYDDPRVTPVGRLLRATGIDELPQLWNVLRGHLSLIGPRPEQPQVIRELGDSVLPYMQRHVVPCGITGWAQIHRGSDAGLDDVLDKIRLDLYYARHFSLWFDLVILLRTFQMLLAGAKPRPSKAVASSADTVHVQLLGDFAGAGPGG